MSHLITRVFPFADRDRWTAPKWRRHTLTDAETQADREAIMAVFVD